MKKKLATTKLKEYIIGLNIIEEEYLSEREELIKNSDLKINLLEEEIQNQKINLFPLVKKLQY